MSLMNLHWCCLVTTEMIPLGRPGYHTTLIISARPKLTWRENTLSTWQSSLRNKAFPKTEASSYFKSISENEAQYLDDDD